MAKAREGCYCFATKDVGIFTQSYQITSSDYVILCTVSPSILRDETSTTAEFDFGARMSHQMRQPLLVQDDWICVCEARKLNKNLIFLSRFFNDPDETL